MDSLINQYNNLSLEEKNLLLIYKSHLSYVINNVYNLNDDVLKECQDIYEYYKKILDNPVNCFIAKVFSSINFSSFDTFIKDMISITNKLNDLKYKMVLTDDAITYRAVSLTSEVDIPKISNGNLISTSLKEEEAYKFFIKGPYINVLYEFELNKGTPCLFVPYAIKTDNDMLKIVALDTQQEIILFKDEMKYDMNMSLEGNVYKVYLKQIDKEK